MGVVNIHDYHAAQLTLMEAAVAFNKAWDALRQGTTVEAMDALSVAQNNLYRASRNYTAELDKLTGGK